jgi:hypothetical protein
MPTDGPSPFLDTTKQSVVHRRNFNKIGRITLAGAFREFPIPTPSSHPYFGISAGPGRRFWFVEHDGNKIAYIRP